MAKSSRRQFLRAAGGITFLALSPAGRGLWAFAAEPDAAPLLFTAQPYVQPGAQSRLVAGRESFVVAWQTEPRAADFKVEYGETKVLGKTAKIERTERLTGAAGKGDSRYNYAATLDSLPLGKRVFYRVSCGGKTVTEGFSTTRRPRGQKIRFVAFGDSCCGARAVTAIAYQAWRANPDFVLNAGDNVYDSGLDTEYARYFFPVYNSPEADPAKGAPLLRAVPLYTVLGNHDVRGRDGSGQPMGDFDKNPGSLAYYTNMHLPLNGFAPSHPTGTGGDPATVANFKNAAGARYPRMANYSFDYGDAHFCCLDANLQIDPTDDALQAWIASDLTGTDATWKFVMYHHPAFNVADAHYTEQHMRALAPLLEKHGVDFVLSGHAHTYQRPRPLRFTPADLTKTKKRGSADRRTPGIWKVDRAFDGVKNTRPDGIFHITTGAGGAGMHDPEHTNDRSKWLHKDDDNLDYVARFVSDRHSLSVFEIDGRVLTMNQVDEHGQTIDSIRVTK